MAKKENPRQRREREEAERKARLKKQEEARSAQKQRQEILRKQEEEQKRREQLRKLVLAENPGISAEKHSSVKAAGLKSAFILPQGQLLMTAFGKGNNAVPEKLVNGETILDLNAQPSFSAQKSGVQFQIRGRVAGEAAADDPRVSGKNGNDLIGIRGPLERQVFGSNFEDNIHVQLAYAILDIEKILAVHVNNVVYEIGNLRRGETAEYDDFIGYISLAKSHAQFRNTQTEKGRYLQKIFDTLLDRRQMAYFGDILYDHDLSQKHRRELRDQKNSGPVPPSAAMLEYEKKCYYIFALLGMLRQYAAHGTARNRTAAFTLDECFDTLRKNADNPEARQEARQVLHELYAHRVAKLNEGFVSKAKKDFEILFGVFSAGDEKEKARLVRDYYDFVVTKSYKNQGFSVKHLREIISLDPQAQIMKEDRFDSVRPRLNRLFDFVVFEHYRTCPQQAEELVARLRAANSDVDKEMAYREEAQRLWPLIRDRVLDRLLPKLDGAVIAAMTGDSFVTDSLLDGIRISENASCFTMLMYLLAQFQDGKEINDLFTTLINAFENIAGFLDVLRSREIDCAFSPEYTMFEHSREMAGELRLVNSFARMSTVSSKPVILAAQFEDALDILGCGSSKLTTQQAVEKMLEKEKVNGKLKNKDSGFRNFILNNVVESARFRYLVRYSNPKKVRTLASSRQVIDFVLKDIPDAQITRYYNSCFGEKTAFSPEMRGHLAGLITGISFEEFMHVRQKLNGTAAEQQEKIRKQAVIRLYLTVLYLLTKNLVYVNSRYFIAFSAAERDAILTDAEKYGNVTAVDKDFRAFARDRLELRAPGRVKDYLSLNLQHSDRWAVTAFRNCTEHLNAVRNADLYIADARGFSSYFSLYHYLVQRTLRDQYAHDSVTPQKSDPEKMIISPSALTGKTLSYFKLVGDHGGYCMDFVKALCIPFSYNLPRYKNLTIDGLFDRNRPGADEKLLPSPTEGSED